MRKGIVYYLFARAAHALVLSLLSLQGVLTPDVTVSHTFTFTEPVNDIVPTARAIDLRPQTFSSIAEVAFTITDTSGLFRQFNLQIDFPASGTGIGGFSCLPALAPCGPVFNSPNPDHPFYSQIVPLLLDGVENFEVKGSTGTGTPEDPLVPIDPPWQLTVRITGTPGLLPTPVPVILVHGWCGSKESFGMMGQFLLEDLNLAKVANFEYDSASGIPRSERRDLRRLASHLARYIQDQMAELGVDQVDVIAHSMGGLLARAWMARLTDMPYSNEIRRLVLAGTPNFGVPETSLDSLLDLLGKCEENSRRVMRDQAGKMFYGSEFLKELTGKWDQKVGESIFPQNILTLVGCTLAASDGECVTDHLVDAGSAALPVETNDYAVRYVKRAHFSSLVDIDSRDHETYQLVKKFLETGTADSFYEASLARGLIVVPLIEDPFTQEPFTQRRRVQFGQNTPFGRRLPHCNNLLLSSPFTPNEPSNRRTGWWTLADVIEGCWSVQVDSRRFISPELEVNVTAGRPTITIPLVVLEK